MAVLLLLALVSLGLSVVGPVWSQQAQRERERELLRIGALYAQAIARYRDLSPGSLKQGPASLEALVLDTRFVGTLRHLRKLYTDPMVAGAGDPKTWGLVRDAAGRITGVFSQSSQTPMARGPVVASGLTLPAARRYADWHFMAPPSTSPSP